MARASIGVAARLVCMTHAPLSVALTTVAVFGASVSVIHSCVGVRCGSVGGVRRALLHVTRTPVRATRATIPTVRAATRIACAAIGACARVPCSAVTKGRFTQGCNRGTDPGGLALSGEI